MKLFRISRIVLTALALVSTVNFVNSDKSDDECRIAAAALNTSTMAATTTATPLHRVVQTIDYTGRARPDQKSLLIVFDATASMAADLEQLRSGAREIVNLLAAQAENPIYNYILSVFRDPGELKIKLYEQ